MTSITMAAHRHLLALACASISLLAGCSGGGSSGDTEEPPPPLAQRIYHNPYRLVDWNVDVRLKGQHHDHPRLNLDRLRAYDDAGYAAVSLMDYSGAPDLPYALKTRLWTPETMLPGDFLAELKNIRIWLPNAEEVGTPYHFTSPFLTRYVEHWMGAPTKQSWQYDDALELIAKIRQFGGAPTLAHPWNTTLVPELGAACNAVEVYSAFAEARRRRGDPEYVARDHNLVMLQYWDKVLEINQSVVGVAVNDHFGPLPAGSNNDPARDSGKIIVLARSATLADYQEAFERGAVFAIRDVGTVKDRYPVVGSISVEKTSVHIDTADSVRWIANGRTVGEGNLLYFSALPEGTRYLRAEISNAEGSAVFTQGFAVRPVGDVNADFIITHVDLRLCDAVAIGTETDPDRVAACAP